MVCACSESVCSISLRPWQDNLASSSLHLFKTFSQLPRPHGEPRFLSFPPPPTHYPRRRRHLGRNGKEVRGGKKNQAWTGKDKDRWSEWAWRRERGWRSALNPTSSCAFNERWGESRDGRQTRKTAFVAAFQMRRNSDRFTSRRKSFQIQKSFQEVLSVASPPQHPPTPPKYSGS